MTLQGPFQPKLFYDFMKYTVNEFLILIFYMYYKLFLCTSLSSFTTLNLLQVVFSNLEQSFFHSRDLRHI